MSLEGYVAIEDDEFLSDTSTKCPVVICIDCSKSMYTKNKEGVSRIERVKNGIDKFYEEIRSDQAALDSLDLCVVGYMNEGYIVREFGFLNPDESSKTLKLKMGGVGDMGAGVLYGLKLLAERKETYKKNDSTYKQPILIVMSDGHPFGADMNLINAHLSDATKQAIDLESNNRLTVLPVYIGDDFKTDKLAKKDLGGLSQVNKVINVDSVSGFIQFFRILSQSISISSGNGDDSKFKTDDEGFFDIDFE